MKYFILSLLFISGTCVLHAQKKYPEPEFSNEICYLKKDSVHVLSRLEKGSSKMESKTRMGGFGGAEMGYNMDEKRSSVRLKQTQRLSFVFSTGASVRTDSPEQDSMMKANGFDPAQTSGFSGMADPVNNIVLYKAVISKDNRKILLQKSGGAFGKKIQSSDKFTFSVKKIREGYWELVIDKQLPEGEYIFTTTGIGMSSMDGSITLFAFGID